MRLIVAGSREIDPRACMSTLDELLRRDGNIGRPDEILSGGARGPDAAGEEWALRNRVALSIFRADWRTLGRRAGPIRNRAMAVVAAGSPDGRGALLAFWNGRSPGTRNMIDVARELGLSVTVIR